MTDRTWDRIGAVCGILGPVLLQVGFGVRSSGWGALSAKAQGLLEAKGVRE